jgi:hypothetical protein
MGRKGTYSLYAPSVALKRVGSVNVARSPYMKITLCRKELAGMKERGAR